MAVGYLRIEVSTANGNLPIENAKIKITDENNKILYELISDNGGNSGQIELYAPENEGTKDPNYTGERYSKYNVYVIAYGFDETDVVGVQIYSGQSSYLPVELSPAISGRQRSINKIVIGPNALENPVPNTGEHDGIEQRVLRDVIIPTYITVHLGRPDANVRDVRVPFIDYIKNVASSEIFPDWPAASLEANILCQISLALNRVYT